MIKSVYIKDLEYALEIIYMHPKGVDFQVGTPNPARTFFGPTCFHSSICSSLVNHIEPNIPAVFAVMPWKSTLRLGITTIHSLTKATLWGM